MAAVRCIKRILARVAAPFDHGCGKVELYLLFTRWAKKHRQSKSFNFSVHKDFHLPGPQQECMAYLGSRALLCWHGYVNRYPITGCASSKIQRWKVEAMGPRLSDRLNFLRGKAHATQCVIAIIHVGWRGLSMLSEIKRPLVASGHREGNLLRMKPLR